MIFAASLLGLLAVVLGVVAIEKKRKDGQLTYPLWRGNLLIPWVMFVLLFAVLVGSVNLPRFFGLVQHGEPVEAVVTSVDRQAHCTVNYNYTVQGKEYTASDSQCGIKAGERTTAYYDRLAPDASTLYIPALALKNELIAIALICVCFPTALVLWLMMTHVIGRRIKP